MTPIHHITHIGNLPRILVEGGLVCDAAVAQHRLCTQVIAYDSIKQRRAVRPVQKLLFGNVAAGGVVADYVPFYFCNRSPMLAAIHKGLVPGYDGGQSEVIYLVSSAEAVAASGLVWCFTDGHAVEGMTEFFDDLTDLPRVDWEAVGTWKWGGRWLLNNPDVKRRKQAEFLVHQRFPWELVQRITVFDRAMAGRVTDTLASTAHRPGVTVEANWYYNT